jgi:hypothetical protein
VDNTLAILLIQQYLEEKCKCFGGILGVESWGTIFHVSLGGDFEGDSEYNFVIKEEEDHYEVSINPQFNVKVTGNFPGCLEWDNECELPDSVDESVWDYLGNNMLTYHPYKIKK